MASAYGNGADLPLKTNVDGVLYKIYGKKLEGSQTSSTITFKLHQRGGDYVVRVDVYSNIPTDKNNGNIRQDLTLDVLHDFTYMIEQSINGLAPLVPDNKTCIDFSDYTWSNGKRSADMSPSSKLLFGITKDSMYYISLLSPDESRPKIQFFLDIPFKHNYYKNGVQLSPAEASRLRALGLATTLSRVCTAKLPPLRYLAYDPNLKKIVEDKNDPPGRSGSNGARSNDELRF